MRLGREEALIVRAIGLVALGLAALVSLSGAGASAQSVEEQIRMVAPPREARPPDLAGPGAREVTRPREADFRRENVRTRHDPVFLDPVSTTQRTENGSAVRFGFSGWTAPPGRGESLVARENAGWLAFGLSIAWGAAPGPEKPAALP